MDIFHLIILDVNLKFKTVSTNIKMGIGWSAINVYHLTIC